jgi:hypothetical protein
MEEEESRLLPPPPSPPPRSSFAPRFLIENHRHAFSSLVSVDFLSAAFCTHELCTGFSQNWKSSPSKQEEEGHNPSVPFSLSPLPPNREG